MAWTASNINPAGLCAIINGNAASSGPGGPFYAASSTQAYSTDTVMVALYGTTPTTATALTDTLAHNAYAAAGGQWIAGSEVPNGSGYTTAGVTVTPKAEVLVSNVVTFQSSGAPAWTTASFTAFGCLVYDNTVTNKYAYCWNYFGGSQTVTTGTFTINWASSTNIFSVTC